MYHDGTSYIIDTVRHGMTAQQTLEQMLWAFRQKANAPVWVIVTVAQSDTIEQRLKVALAKARAKIVDESNNPGLQKLRIKQFSLKCSKEIATLGDARAALRFNYVRTKKHKLNLAIMRALDTTYLNAGETNE